MQRSDGRGPQSPFSSGNDFVQLGSGMQVKAMRMGASLLVAPLSSEEFLISAHPAFASIGKWQRKQVPWPRAVSRVTNPL